ncbi:MAG: tryptophan synthase subunit alpha [Patescibacteria group bacterium]|nr:tryptophan synthase subunit alpha [Patescibacteria group bacterium]
MKKNGRLIKKIKGIRSRGGKTLVFFLTTGFPDLNTTEKTILALERGGADIIELGVPFSDPVADGTSIQFSSQKALEKGISLKRVLAFIRSIRKKTDIPIVLMSYLNPIYAFGTESFFKSAMEVGIDGVLITDAIPEESPVLRKISLKYAIPLIFLTAPTTSPKRQKLIANKTGGFLYAVSLTGVTGEREKVCYDIIPFLIGLKKMTDKPIFVGFGISKPDHAKFLKKYSDGIIIGSALVNLIMRTPLNLLPKKAETFARKFRTVLDG